MSPISRNTEDDLLPLKSISFAPVVALSNGRKRVLSPAVSRKISTTAQPGRQPSLRQRLQEKTFESSAEMPEKQQYHLTALPSSIHWFQDTSKSLVFVYAHPYLPPLVRINPIVFDYKTDRQGLFLATISQIYSSVECEGRREALWIDRFDSGEAANGLVLPTVTMEGDLLIAVSECSVFISWSSCETYWVIHRTFWMWTTMNVSRWVPFCSRFHTEPIKILTQWRHQIIKKHLELRNPTNLFLNPLKFFYSTSEKRMLAYVPSQTLQLMPLLPFSWSPMNESPLETERYGFMTIDTKRHVHLHSFASADLSPVVGMWVHSLNP